MGPFTVFCLTFSSEARSSPHPPALFRSCLRPSGRVPARSTRSGGRNQDRNSADWYGEDRASVFCPVPWAVTITLRRRQVFSLLIGASEFLVVWIVIFPSRKVQTRFQRCWIPILYNWISHSQWKIFFVGWPKVTWLVVSHLIIYLQGRVRLV